MYGVSGKPFSPDKCAGMGGLVRTGGPCVSANGPFRVLFDIPAEGVPSRQIEKKAAKSTAEPRLAGLFFRRCGRLSGFVRTTPRVIAHKKSVFSAMPSASFRKESGVFAEKWLKLAI